MKVSVERLRWGLAGAVVLLLVGLFALVSYGRYAAAKKWKDILAKNGIHLSQESDNVTWSQTVKGRTVFTIRAKKALPLSQGKWTLRGVTLLLYGKTPDRVDRVEGAEFEYDEKAEVATAIGEVHMDIQAPSALIHGKLDAPASPAGASGDVPGRLPDESGLDAEKNVIHVLTSGLVYLRKLGVAATDQRVEFRYAGMTCVSKGAEFDTSGNALHLLADVEMHGEVHGEAAVLHAVRADLDREKNTIALVQPAVSSRGESARAANALLLLHTDGSLQQADGTGGVTLENAGRRVGAQQMHAVFGAQNAPEAVALSGGVTLEGAPAKPMHGTAAETDLAFAPSGAVKTVMAKGAVRLVSSLVRAGSAPLARELRGEQVMASFRPEGHGTQVSLQQVHAVGGAFARGESIATVKPGTKTPAGMATSGVVATQVSADDLLATFAAPAGKNADAALQHLAGRGHARLQQSGLNGATEESSSDMLEVSFAAEARSGVAASAFGTGAMRLQNAVQTGHVQIRDQAATQGGKRGALSLAQGDRGVFDAAANRLTLSGGAAYQQEGTSLTAASVSVEQGSGNAEAQGGVEVSVVSAGIAPGDATHVLADRARLIRAAQTAEFFGTDAHPARLWQAGSQVLAANLFLDETQQSLTARPAAGGGAVEAVFSTQGRRGGVKTAAQAVPQSAPQVAPGTKENAVNAGEAVHVTSAALHYSGQRHEVVCSGGVRMRQGDMRARSQGAVVFLSDSKGQQKRVIAKPGGGSLDGLNGVGELGGTLERMVLSGNVRLDAPLGAGDGEQLVYTAKDDSYVLTGSAGKMPRVASTGQGMVTGPALLFRRGEKSVIVNGAGASNDQSPDARLPGGRVHTDVVVRPQQR